MKHSGKQWFIKDEYLVKNTAGQELWAITLEKLNQNTNTFTSGTPICLVHNFFSNWPNVPIPHKLFPLLNFLANFHICMVWSLGNQWKMQQSNKGKMGATSYMSSDKRKKNSRISKM